MIYNFTLQSLTHINTNPILESEEGKKELVDTTNWGKSLKIGKKTKHRNSNKVNESINFDSLSQNEKQLYKIIKLNTSK